MSVPVRSPSRSATVHPPAMRDRLRCADLAGGLKSAEDGRWGLTAAQELDLAREPAFRLGCLTIVPISRELRHDDGRCDILEHRVMQVLVTLAQAGGHVVSRDDLVQRCWSGRAVSEDAINRVISRLRKVAGGIGAGSFGIETVTKIGYRLADGGNGEDGLMMPVTMPAGSVAAPDRPAIARRAMLIGGGSLIAAAGGGALLYRRFGRPAVSPEVQALMTQGWQQWEQGSPGGLDQATGLFRRATMLAPDYADAWGLLGCAHALKAHAAPGSEAEPLRDRSRSAAREAMRLDPHNAYGRCAIAHARPTMGNWLVMERGFREALAGQPDRKLVLHCLATSLLAVGRCGEAAREYARLTVEPDPPSHYILLATAEAGAGRIDRAERLADEGAAVYPGHAALWSLRFNQALFGGRPGDARAMLANAQDRPEWLDGDRTAERLDLCDAVQHREPVRVAQALERLRALARDNASAAPFAIMAAAALGRIDDACALLDAFYFSRGFTVPDVPPEPGRVAGATLNERTTAFLFLPVMRPVRADPRFARLTGALGLERYWREAGAQPDYRMS